MPTEPRAVRFQRPSGNLTCRRVVEFIAVRHGRAVWARSKVWCTRQFSASVHFR